MFRHPKHWQNLSQRLAAVLDDIGVNERLVIKRRRTWLLYEAMWNVEHQLNGENMCKYTFGSQTEGCTTLGLNSDIDNLTCLQDFKCIQDWSEWEHSVPQLLMVQDTTTAPGHCLLQLLERDVPLPRLDCQHEHFRTDEKGRVLLRHSQCLVHIGDMNVRHGPAGAHNLGPDQYEFDHVLALGCSTWPYEAKSWIEQECASGWPTADIKRKSGTLGCFIVPVSSWIGTSQDVEWRISTSNSERLMMFSLNITQISCYILIKMILKTFIKPRFDEAISSFICKTVLFHCIAQQSIQWKTHNLVTCLSYYLQTVSNCILTNNCPHFIIPKHNLMAGKLSAGIKHDLLKVLGSLKENIGHILLRIHTDDLGNNLYEKSCRIPVLQISLVNAENNANEVARRPFYVIAEQVQQLLKKIVTKVSHDNPAAVYQQLIQTISRLCCYLSSSDSPRKTASSLLIPFLCTTVASIRANADIFHISCISPEALKWFGAGLNSDVSSSMLKLASAFYGAGNMEQCEIFLNNLISKFEETTVQTMCVCYVKKHQDNGDFGKVCNQEKEDVLKHHVAFCVRFYPFEDNCIPKELKYEMFRSTDIRPFQDKPGKPFGWINLVEVDSLAYLYFLQYKVYRQLGKGTDQHRALQNLATTIDTEANLGHKETALNLLGQCMEQENRKNFALYMYMKSLKLKWRNNAAKWLLCRLLSCLLKEGTSTRK